MLAFVAFILLALTTASALRADLADKIEKYRQELLKIDNPQIKDIDLEKAPDLGFFEDLTAGQLYQSAKNIGSGIEAIVYMAPSAMERADVDIKKGQQIVVRVVPIFKNQSNRNESNLWSFRNFIRAEKLRKDAISEFFPRFYGGFRAKFESMPDWPFHMFQEMEPIDATLAAQFNCGESMDKEKDVVPMSDCFVLEFCLGEWAGAYFGDIGSEDAKAENAGVKKVNHSRSYSIQGKEYIFPKTQLSPKRIDIGGAGEAEGEKNEKHLRSYACSLQEFTSTSSSNGSCQTQNSAQEFLTALKTNKEEGKSVFDIFADFYDQAKCGESGKNENHESFKWPKIKIENN